MTPESIAVQIKTVFELGADSLPVLERMTQQFIESHERSKWIAYDPQNPNTWPPKTDEYLVKSLSCKDASPYVGLEIFGYKGDIWYSWDEESDCRYRNTKFWGNDELTKNITHWQPKPIFKQEQAAKPTVGFIQNWRYQAECSELSAYVSDEPETYGQIMSINSHTQVSQKTYQQAKAEVEQQLQQYADIPIDQLNEFDYARAMRLIRSLGQYQMQVTPQFKPALQELIQELRSVADQAEALLSGDLSIDQQDDFDQICIQVLDLTGLAQAANENVYRK